MPIKDILLLHSELAKLDNQQKLPNRLKALRNAIIDLNDREADDLEAYQNYLSNHEPTHFIHKGHIPWQGSEAQELLGEDHFSKEWSRSHSSFLIIIEFGMFITSSICLMPTRRLARSSRGAKFVNCKISTISFIFSVTLCDILYFSAALSPHVLAAADDC